MAEAKKSDDPTVTSASGEGRGGLAHAPKVEDADHSTVDKKYRDNPDKPNKSTVAQVEDVPEGWPHADAVH